jgi:hypothetical protein
VNEGALAQWGTVAPKIEKRRILVINNPIIYAELLIIFYTTKYGL